MSKNSASLAGQLDLRRNRQTKLLVGWTLFLIVAMWCAYGTIIQDTDWSRIGGRSGVLASIGRYISLDLKLLPELLIPTIETFMMACVGTILGCVFSLPVAWLGPPM